MLDISVHSPGDSQHNLKYLQFESDAGQPRNDVQVWGQPSRLDFRHGWVAGRQLIPPSDKSISRLFQDVELTGDFWINLPKVTVVTGLLLRCQRRRRWEPTTLESLLVCLPSQQNLHYGPWGEWN